MKAGHFFKCILLLCLIFSATNVKGQLPSWLWAQNSNSVNCKAIGSAIAVDSLGNSFVAGYFSCDSISIGGVTIYNHDTVSFPSSEIFIVKYNTLGAVQWVRQIGGKDYDSAFGIDIDSQGNVYVAGAFTSDTLFLDNAPLLTNAGWGSDIFIVKYDSNGNQIGLHSFGGLTGDNLGGDINVDDTGNIYLTGNTRSTLLDFGGFTLNGTGSQDVFVVKFDAAFNPLWAHITGGNTTSFGTDLATDSNGNVYIFGMFALTITFDNDTLVSAGDRDLFITKYDASGNRLWTKSISGTGNDYSGGLAVDGFDNLFVTGSFESPALQIGNATLNNYLPTLQQTDFFIAKFDTGANMIWVRAVGGNKTDNSNDIKTDALGNAYLVGEFYSDTTVFGNTVLTNWTLSGAIRSKIFVVRYDQSGNIDWVRNSTGFYWGHTAAALDVDPSGATYITGLYFTTITFGNIVLNNNLQDSYFIAKLDSSSFTEIDEIEITDGQIEMYPNPAQDCLNYKKLTPETAELTISDITGRIVIVEQLNNANGQINVSKLTPGYYFAFVKMTSGKEYIHRFIKK